MTKRKQTRNQSAELDSTYLLKLVLYLLIGSQWLRLIDLSGNRQIPIPVGFIIGLLFAWHDHFQMDRKIEYALLLVAMFVSFWLPMGIEVLI